MSKGNVWGPEATIHRGVIIILLATVPLEQVQSATIAQLAKGLSALEKYGLLAVTYMLVADLLAIAHWLSAVVRRRRIPHHA